MQNRVIALDGKMELHSSLDSGTCIYIRFDLQENRFSAGIRSYLTNAFYQN